MLERRRDIREAKNLRGVIRYGAAGQEIPCTVANLTPRGAGLSLGTTFGVPEVFHLRIDGEPHSRHCRVAWTNSKMLGVAFQ